MMRSPTLNIVLFLIVFSLVLFSCNPSPKETPSPPSPEQTAQATPETFAPTEIASPVPSSTPAPSLVILVAASESGDFQPDTLANVLAELADSQGLEFQVRQTLTPGDLETSMRLVVALPPDPDLASLAAAAPNIQFLGIGIPGLAASQNLSLIGSQGMRPEQQGFLAGYIAAMVTPEWRTGVISTSDNPTGLAARKGFVNGVLFFCGLCQQTYPPFYDYPIYVELPSEASQDEWQAATDVLIDQVVKTVYVAPGAGGEELLVYLAQAGVNIIGNVSPPPTLQAKWVASIRPAYLQSVQEIWPDLMNRQGGASLPIILEIVNVNENLFSPGRQRLAQEFLADLMAGFIDTGVDPVTGEER